MAFLLRVDLPDVPGSLGALATALGAAGADIEVIEIVERSADGRVVDDVLLELPSDVMPDALVTACHRLEDVEVQWVSRYNAGASVRMDLEAVEAITEEPSRAVELLVDLIPTTFRADWAVALRRAETEPEVVRATATAPTLVPEASGWFDLSGVQELPVVAAWESTILVGAPIPELQMVVVFGRHGGPAVLRSELARFGHITALAASVRAGA